MSTTTTYTGVRIADMPDLGAVNDASSVVGEHAGSGRFSATALRDYLNLTFATDADLMAETAARTAADVALRSYVTASSSFATIAALRANATSQGAAAVEVGGYHVTNDGGGGTFVCDPTDTTAADNAGTVIVDAAGQRWRRDMAGLPLNVKWFGARGDGVTDDQPAFQAAFNAAVTDPRGVWAPGVTSSYNLVGYLASGNLTTPNYRVNALIDPPYTNIDQFHTSGAPVYNQVNAERFGYSVRNCNVTAYQIYSSIGISAFTDVLQGVAHMVAGTPSTLAQMSAVAGYIKNDAPQLGGFGGGPNAVALFGAGTAEVDGAATWGINTLLQDQSNRFASAGTATLINEFDFNVMKTGTSVTGLILQGSSLSQPSDANCIGIGQLAVGAAGTVVWDNGILFLDGASTTAMGIGMQHANVVANDNSQPIIFLCRDNAGAVQTTAMYVQGTALGSNIEVAFAASAPLQLQIGGPSPIGLAVGTHNVVGPRIPGWGAPLGGTRAQLNPATATLPQAIDALNALIFDLLTHGLIGA